MKVLKYVIVLLVVVALSGCPAMRPKHLARPEAIQSESTYTHTASGMTFPLSVGNFHRSKIIRYDVEGLDMSAGYDLATVAGYLSVTVYVYPAPSLISIGSPPNVIAAARNRLAEDEFAARKLEIMQYRPGVILIQEREVSLRQGNAENLGKMATFEYEEDFAGQRQLLRSHLYLFCFAGDKWTIKYRFTHSRFFDPTQEIEKFMTNLSWTLK